MDLAGKLIIKVNLDDDIRRIPIHNEDITYDELILMMQRVFKGRLAHCDELLLKYKDEDGDLITIMDDSDLAYAIQCSRILKLKILYKTGRSTQSEDGLDLMTRQGIRCELKSMRDRLNYILDNMDTVGVDNIPDIAKKHVDNDDIKVDSSKSKEFDPLSSNQSKNQGSTYMRPVQNGDENTQSKVASSFNLPSGTPNAGTPLRSGTPDSQRSVGVKSSIGGDVAAPPAGPYPPHAYPPISQGHTPDVHINRDAHQQPAQSDHSPPNSLASGPNSYNSGSMPPGHPSGYSANQYRPASQQQGFNPPNQQTPYGSGPPMQPPPSSQAPPTSQQSNPGQLYQPQMGPPTSGMPPYQPGMPPYQSGGSPAHQQYPGYPQQRPDQYTAAPQYQGDPQQQQQSGGPPQAHFAPPPMRMACPPPLQQASGPTQPPPSRPQYARRLGYQ